MPRSLSVVLSLFLLTHAAPGQGRVAAPAVRMTLMSAKVEVVDGVATTTLAQTWRNDGAGEAEATWILPLPAGGVADGLVLRIDGKPVSGEVLDQGRARDVYEGIVRSRRDPALLEYFGRGCLRARIFPIPARGETRVDVTFRQVLPELAGLRRWSFPVTAAGAAGLAPERIVLDLALRSRKALKNVFAPLPGVRVNQKDDHEARASFEGAASAIPGGELAVLYGLSEAEFGLDLLTQRSAGDEQGTFLMLLSPKREWQTQETLKKSIAFVLDTSGSMEGEKIAQAKAALKQFLSSLGPEDVFDVVPFATEAEPFFGRRVRATPERLAEAQERVERITASGGTNIEAALTAALKGRDDEGRVPFVVFLTDGAPTVGVTDPAAIEKAVGAANGDQTRLFVLGVGNDVQTHLLDRLAAANGGARDYVREREAIDDKTRALFARLAHPVMTDLVLTVDGLTPSKVVPAVLPDLFAGDRLELFGRYGGEGVHAIRLSGLVGGTRREYVYEGSFARESGPENAFLASLWAERRVAVLLDELRLHGANPELVGEIERLGREFRIVTPYTSHLVVEPGLRTAAGGGTFRGPGDTAGPATGPAGPTSPGVGPASRATTTGSDSWFLGRGDKRPEQPSLEELAAQLGKEGVLPPDAPRERLVELARQVAQELMESERRWNELGEQTTGAQAVDESQYLARLVARGEGGSARTLLELFTRRVKDKTFVLRRGTWIDQALGETLPGSRTVVEAFSPEYFALLAAQPALAPYVSFSTRLVVKLGERVFEVVDRAPEAAGARRE